jgi:hypothetical protein
MLGFLFAFACAPTDPDASHDRDGSDALRAPQRLDDCKPTLHGPPEITIGQGQTDYVDIAEGETLQIEKGPQGGYHVWLAVRMKNLLRSGSRTLIEANVVSTGFALQSYEVGFTFDLDEDGFCELHGLRYRIDSDGVDYRTLLGDALDLHVEISDESGSSAGASTRILLSGDVI